MIIKTTLYLKINILTQINRVSKALSITQSALIVVLLKRMMEGHSTLLRPYGSIRYQNNIEDTTWSRLHISLYSRDYECFIDLRKFTKHSVSFLVAIAIERYLNEILNIAKKGGSTSRITDNYNQYIIIRDIINNAICWRIYWDLPEDQGKLFHPPKNPQ